MKPPTPPPTTEVGIAAWETNYSLLLSDGMDRITKSMQDAGSMGFLVNSFHSEHKDLRGMPLIEVAVYERVL